MTEMQFSVEINAPKERIWETLWGDKTFRDWAGIVDPGTYMVGELAEGSVVQFNSAEGYGVTSTIARLTPKEYILFKHKADTKDHGASSREEQWTGGSESYKLTEKNGITTLTLEFDVPAKLRRTMEVTYPKALSRIKELSETYGS